MRIISASQIETHNLCHRKWWFDKIKKIPRKAKRYFHFGTVMHKVIERFLTADDQGYHDGKPVDLYPEDWAKGLNSSEAEHIQHLMKQGLADGTIDRFPGRLLEHEFWMPVMDGVQLTGFVDVLLPGEVQDHKTTKDWRYAKSAAKLKTNAQVLVYAMVVLHEAERKGEPPPQEVTVRHNIFCKDPDVKEKTRVVSVTVTRDEILQHWIDNVIGTAATMQKEAEIEEWFDVEGAENKPGACNMYGGCDFLKICGGVITPDKFAKRVLKSQKKGVESGSSFGITRKVEVVGNFDELMNRAMQEKKIIEAAEDDAAEDKQEPEPEPAAVAVDEGSPLITYPWASPQCIACEGVGLNSKGAVCKTCFAKRLAAGLPTHEDFDILSVEGEVEYVTPDSIEIKDGLAFFKEVVDPTEKEKIAQALLEEMAQEKPGLEPLEPPKKKRGRPKGSKNKKPTPEVVHEPGPVETKIAEPRHGFRLFINCGSRGGSRKILSIALLLENWGGKLAADCGASSYYELDAFKRRDAMAKYLDLILDSLEGVDLQCNNMAPDQTALLEMLSSYASEVFEGYR